MFQRLRNFFFDRRRGLATAVGVVGALYMVGRYVLERLEEMREQVAQAKRAREKCVLHPCPLQVILN